MTLRALIVDDEPPARAELRFQLERQGDVEVIGEAQSAREALALLEALTYDVVFLDIEMPALSGLELARRMGAGEGGRPFVVFVTAHDRHALEAFGVQAVDYLLKPVEPRRLAATIERLRLLGQKATPPARTGGEAPRFLAGHAGESAFPVALEDVSYLAAEGDSVHVVTTAGRRLGLRGATLADMERLLPPDRFFRCHRGYLVQVGEVAEIVPFFSGTYLLRMKGSRDEVPVSRSRVRRLKDLFHLS